MDKQDRLAAVKAASAAIAADASDRPHPDCALEHLIRCLRWIGMFGGSYVPWAQASCYRLVRTGPYCAPAQALFDVQRRCLDDLMT